MAFTALTSGQTDADSPLNQVLFDLIRTNFDDLVARFSTSAGHDHDGSDSKLVISVVNAEVASASTLPVLNPGYADVSGTTTITAISALDVGAEISLRFNGILTLIDDGDNLRLPNGGNITTVAGMVLNFIEVVSGKWKCTSTDSVVRAILTTDEVSVAASISAGATALVVLDPYSFFPMIHTSTSEVRMTGHTTDAGDSNFARFGFYNTSGSDRSFDVDYRYIKA